MPTVKLEVVFKNISYTGWLCRDYRKRLTNLQMLAKVKKYVRNGSVITFHDSIKSEPRLKYTLSNSSWLYVQGIR